MSALASQIRDDVLDARTPRQRSFIGVTIVHGPDMMTLDCVVRDASDTGAKLSVPPLTVLPERFWLLDRRQAVAYDARLVWRRGDFAGVEFVGERALDEARDHETRMLRRIWIEKAPRAGID